MSSRIDSILFDVKESLDDFGNEIKLLISENVYFKRKSAGT